jgi:uncharacterized zinc-type alcohol dehydrogenase-like protein
MTRTQGYAAHGPSDPLVPFAFDRREPGPTDVQIGILFCGVCHSDLHTARNEWHGTTYPVVPGHEIVGRVERIGAAVTAFRPGDLAGVGCMVDSCRTCPDCADGLEQFCRNGTVFTYNSPDRHLGGMTYGGYSGLVVVDEKFVLRIPGNLDPSAAAPLLCAGITTWSPLRHWKVGKGDTVGIVGLGGLGHMGLKFAHALGAHTVLFTTSMSKAEDARRLGADEVVLSKEPGEMRRQGGRFDFILNAVAAPHDLDPFLLALKRDGTMCMLGAPASPHPSPSVGNLIFGRRCLAGSLIGGVAETQEMLDFCGANGIACDVERIAMAEINTAYERMLRSDVKYRFVIDMATLAAAD